MLFCRLGGGTAENKNIADIWQTLCREGNTVRVKRLPLSAFCFNKEK